MKLRTKLTMALAPLAAVLIALGAAAIRTTTEMGELSERILRDNYRSVLAAQRMKEALERIDSAAAFRALGQRAKAEGQERSSEERFEQELRVQEANITEVGEAEATRALRASWSGYLAAARAYRTLPEADQRGAYFSSMEPLFLAVKAAADLVLDLNQDAMVRKSDEARRVSQRNVTTIAISTLAAILLGVIASALLTDRALRPLAILSHAVRRLGEGDLAARAAVHGQDEIAQLAREFNTMAQSLGDYRRSSLGELLQAQQASQAAIDSLPDPVVVLSNDGEVLNVNDAAGSVLRVGAGNTGGGPLAGVEPGMRALLEKVRLHVVAGKGPYVPRGFEESVRLDLDGQARWLLPRATPVYSEEGAIVGASIILQDVTRLMRFDELKDDLVATVAHEFRTPLTSLRMAIHVCLEGLVGPLTLKQAEMLQTARSDCERLQTIVEDLLDLSRIQAGKVEVSTTPLSCKALVEGAVEQRQGEAARAGVVLARELIEPVLPVLADPERISLVLDNLVSNALKHAPRGSEVKLRAEPEGKLVRFSVADSGAGIAREHQQRVFEKFYRVPGEKGDGVGLGLYIAREIVRAHGGEMGVESAPGEGARFWFTLPVAGGEA